MYFYIIQNGVLPSGLTRKGVVTNVEDVLIGQQAYQKGWALAILQILLLAEKISCVHIVCESSDRQGAIL